MFVARASHVRAPNLGVPGRSLRGPLQYVSEYDYDTYQNLHQQHVLEPDSLYDSRRVLSPAAEISALSLVQFTATIYTGEWLVLLRPRAITIQLAGHTADRGASIKHLSSISR